MTLPAPEPGLVISYAYLWHDEYKAGNDEGRKDRPAAIVLTTERKDDSATIVVVLPVTHSPPVDVRAAIEIPLGVKRHLGLDDQRSWIIVSEGNEFIWPGYDLRKRSNSDRYDYGFLPPNFYDQVRETFERWYQAGKLKTTPR